jgi:cysteine desulfurase/selenocysteine lyase
VTTEAKKPDLEKVNLERRSTSARPALVADGRLDVDAVRADFPILATKVHGKPLVYLDNAASSQKPRAVIDALRTFYGAEYANIHRGVHYLSEIATDAYEKARATAQRFLNAGEAREIVFVRSTTEGINLIARSFARPSLTPGDEILISEMEHHSNIVPWQQLCARTGATLKAVPIDDRGQLVTEEFDRLLSPRTKIVAMTHVSNALGTVNPVAELTARAKAAGATVLIDGSQAAHHMPVNVQTIGADFYVLTGHKMYGPTGIGVLHGREAVLEAMEPFLGGGDMIRTVAIERSTWNDLPYKFEAGTPHISGAIGLAAAIRYLQKVGVEAIAAHEAALVAKASAALQTVPGVKLVGTAAHKASVVSFVMDGVHPHDIGTIVDREGVAIRTGHHCAQPVMDWYGIPATARASFAMYNTLDEVDALASALHRAHSLLA